MLTESETLAPSTRVRKCNDDEEPSRQIEMLSSLPTEIIVMIMRYLSLPDKMSVRLVCHRLRNASFAQCLTKDYTTAVNSCLSLESHEERKYANLRITDFSRDDKNCLQYWQACGDTVKSLEIYGTPVNDPRLQEIFPLLTNLEHLLLSPCGASVILLKQIGSTSNQFAFQFPELLSLEFWDYDTKSLDLENFKAFIALAPQLKKIGLIRFGMGTLSGECVKRRLECLIEIRGQVLEELNLNHSTCLAEVSIIFPRLGTQLTRLHLKYAGEKSCAPGVLTIIAESFPNLKVLDLSGSYFKDQDLSCLISRLKLLTHISLCFTSAGPMTMSSIAEHLAHLVFLEVYPLEFEMM